MPGVSGKGGTNTQLYHTQGRVEADTLQIKPEVLHVLHGVQDVQASLKRAAAAGQVVVGVTDSGVDNHSVSPHIHKDLSDTAWFRLGGQNRHTTPLSSGLYGIFPVSAIFRQFWRRTHPSPPACAVVPHCPCQPSRNGDSGFRTVSVPPCAQDIPSCHRDYLLQALIQDWNGCAWGLIFLLVLKVYAGPAFSSARALCL